jgi:orotidine-5'-phosphate decarboxylase
MQNMGVKAPIFLAVDTDDLKVAQEWIRATQDYVSGYKFGLEFFCAFGSEGIRQLKESTDSDIFLDLKLHDIPNTVVGATRQIISLRPRFLSVHALGGSAMIAAAVAEAPNIEIAAVTILTSLGSQDLTQMGYDLSPSDAVVKLALLAKSAGARAIICSPLEIMAIREAIGPEISIITPGVRPSLDASNDDQFRKMDPKSAIQAGATYLVIGRPITSAWAQGASALRDRAAAISSQLK